MLSPSQIVLSTSDEVIVVVGRAFTVTVVVVEHPLLSV